MAVTIQPIIFISYFEPEALDLADAVKDDLIHHGYSAFVAKRDLKKGERQDIVIMKRIRECLIFVPILTSGALKSTWVDKEITEAQKLGKHIIPCKHKYLKWSELEKWNLTDVNGVEFGIKEELLRELIPDVLEHLGRMQGLHTAFTIKVDKSNYSAGEIINISGTVPAIIEGVLVEISVFNPAGTVYTIDLLTPNSDGTYSSSIKVGGKLGINGIYTVNAGYAGQNIQANFSFAGAQAQQAGTIRVEFEGNVWNLNTSLSNGNIMRVMIDLGYTSIIVPVLTSETQNGELEMTLPRELIDARIDGKDDTFIVLVDGKESNFTETEATSTSRTIKIPIPAATEKIEIIGTVIFPKEKEQENVAVVMISKGASNISNPRFYVPKEIKISSGTKVIWVNLDAAGHTVTSGNPGDSDFGALFDSTKDPSAFLVKPGTTWEWAFDTSGTFSYFCQVHPWEIGRIIVED